MATLEFKTTVSRGRDTYGYNIVSLYVDGRKVSSCNGGGYDMRGTALGDWIAGAYRARLNALKPEDMEPQSYWDNSAQRTVDEGRSFYGLTYHDPTFDPGKAIIGEGCDDRTLGGDSKGLTVAEAEAAGKTVGLERYQAFYRASSKVPTPRHTEPSIDGGCGFSSVERIMKAIGLDLTWVPTRSSKSALYTLNDHWVGDKPVEPGLRVVGGKDVA